MTNEYKYPRYNQARFSASLGYITIAIDSRGSWNRGLEFEGSLKGKMGTDVELVDQIDGLLFLLRGYGKLESEGERDEIWKGLDRGTCRTIDPDRVVIKGWSYGGYMSLMGIALYPSVFCGAVPGMS